MNNIEYVLVYDSGIGGLTTLSELIKLCPTLNYLYFADTNNCPYGNKCNSQLNSLIYNNIKNMQRKYKITHIVLACNTATTCSIGYLRQNFNIPIIGTEPNVKTPSRKGYKKILVLSTPATASTEKLHKLESTITPVPHNLSIKSLAYLIEEYKVNNNQEKLNEAQKVIDKVLKYIPKTTAIVLGCTHYIYLREYIEKKGYTCFDGNIGVSKRVESIIKYNHNKSENKGKLQIITGNTRTNLIYRKILYNYLNHIK